MNIEETLNTLAELGAGWILWLLVGLSVLALGIVLERGVALTRARVDPRALRLELQRLLDAGSIDEARALLRASGSYEGQIVLAGLRHEELEPAAVEDSMAAERAAVKADMERNLSFLGTVGNNAPFVGLLGTVIGIIKAFQELDASAGQVTQGLMTEVGEALVATAVGLLVALPAVAFYNLLLRVVRGRLQVAESLGLDLLAHLRRGRAAGGAG